MLENWRGNVEAATSRSEPKVMTCIVGKVLGIQEKKIDLEESMEYAVSRQRDAYISDRNGSYRTKKENWALQDTGGLVPKL